MKSVIFAIFFILSSSLFAQNNIDAVWKQVEENNTKLLVLKQKAEAEKIGNKTGIYLENPEVEFNYLWGNPTDLGNRVDFKISQSFDFPTAYAYRKQISNIKNQQIEFEYERENRNLQLQTRLFCFDLIYTNTLKTELLKRLNHAESIANSYKKKYEKGEINILEYNKAQLNLLNLKEDIKIIEIKRNTFLSELTLLNAGKSINFVDTIFQKQEIPLNFEQWYETVEQNSPMLKWLKLEIEKSQKQEKLSKSLSLPSIQAGYMSEKIAGEHFQGISIGISIPLWKNKNTVKYAKAKTIANQSFIADNKLQLYNKLKKLHAKTVDLQNNANNYRKNLASFDNSKLLKIALKNGEINLLNYILELSIYYESMTKLLALERDLNKTFAKLMQYQ